VADLKFKKKIATYVGKDFSGRVITTVLSTQLIYTIDTLSSPIGSLPRPGKVFLN
jgi:dihydroorotase-like cyclic amidohydrolase